MGSAAEFCLKIWAVVIFGSPAVVGLINSTFTPFVYLVIVGWSILCSVPALIIFLLFTGYINKQAMEVIIKKMILAAGGFALIYITFEFVNLSGDAKYYYGGLLAAAVFIFPLKPPEKPVEE